MLKTIIFLAIISLAFVAADDDAIECGVKDPKKFEDCSAKPKTGRKCCYSSGTSTDPAGKVTNWAKCSDLAAGDIVKGPYFEKFTFGKTKITIKMDCGADATKDVSKFDAVCNKTKLDPTVLTDCTGIAKAGERTCCMITGNSKSLCVWSEPKSTTNYNLAGLQQKCTDTGKIYGIWDPQDYKTLVKLQPDCGATFPTKADDCNKATTAVVPCCYTSGRSGGADGIDWTPACEKTDNNLVILAPYFSSFVTSNPTIEHTWGSANCGGVETTKLKGNTIVCGTNTAPKTLADCDKASTAKNKCCIVLGKSKNICIWAEDNTSANTNYWGLKKQCNSSGSFTNVWTEDQYKDAVKDTFKVNSAAFMLQAGFIFLFSLIFFF